MIRVRILVCVDVARLLSNDRSMCFVKTWSTSGFFRLKPDEEEDALSVTRAGRVEKTLLHKQRTYLSRAWLERSGETVQQHCAYSREKRYEGRSVDCKRTAEVLRLKKWRD